jgi:hypothetical protein
MIQLENRWTDLDEIWYGLCAIGDFPKIVLLNYLQSIIPKWRSNRKTMNFDSFLFEYDQTTPIVATGFWAKEVQE